MQRVYTQHELDIRFYLIVGSVYKVHSVHTVHCSAFTVYTMAIKSPKPTTIERFKRKSTHTHTHVEAKSKKNFSAKEMLKQERNCGLRLTHNVRLHTLHERNTDENCKENKNTNQRNFRRKCCGGQHYCVKHRTRSHEEHIASKSFHSNLSCKLS